MGQDLVGKLQALVQIVELAGGRGALEADIGRQGLADLKVARLDRWTTSSVARLARLAGFDDSVVWSDAPLPTRSSIRHFRGGALVVEPPDQQAFQGAVSLVEAVQALSTWPASVGDLSARQRPKADKVWDQGYLLARKARRRGERHLQPHATAPIPSVVAFIEDTFHIPVLFVRFAVRRLEGVTVAAGGVTTILVDARLMNHLPVLRRTLAHELCHALHDPRDGEGLFLTLDGPDELEPEEPFEQRARAFAAELLVPEAALRPKESRTASREQVMRRVLEESDRFGAPPTMTRLHLANRGVIGREWESMSLDVPVETSITHLKDAPGRLVFRALAAAVAADEISAGRARELMALVPGLTPPESPLDLGT